MTADVSIRAKRRYKELKSQGYKITFNDILVSIKERDKSDFKRKISPLKKTKDAILIDSSKLSINECFKKMKFFINKKYKSYEKN